MKKNCRICRKFMKHKKEFSYYMDTDTNYVANIFYCSTCDKYFILNRHKELKRISGIEAELLYKIDVRKDKKIEKK